MGNSERPFMELPREEVVTPPWHIRFVPTLVGLLFLVSAASYFFQTNALRDATYRDHMVRELLSYSKNLERQVENAFTATTLIAASLQTSQNLGNFQPVAARLLQLHGGISTLQIAPGGQLWQSEGRSRADNIRQTTLPDSLPVGFLVPTGAPGIQIANEVLLISQKIQAWDGLNRQLPWGEARAIVRLTDLIESSNLEDLPLHGIDYRVTLKRPDGILHSLGDTAPTLAFDVNLTHQLQLSNGDSLILALRPQKAPDHRDVLVLQIGFSIVCALLLSMLVHHALRTPRRVYAENERRAEDLAYANRKLQETNAVLDAIVQNIPFMIVLKDARSRVIRRINRSGEVFSARVAEEVIGGTDEAYLPSELLDESRQADDRVVAGHQPYLLPECTWPGERGPRTLNISKIPLKIGGDETAYILEIGEDITQHKLAERRLHLLNRTLLALSAINEAIVRCQERDLLLQESCRILVQEGELALVWLAWLAEDGETLEPAQFVVGEPAEFVPLASTYFHSCDRPCGNPSPTTYPGLVVCEVDRCGNTMLTEAMKPFGLYSTAHIPLFIRETKVGVIGVHSIDSRLFDTEERKLFNTLSANLSHALERFALEEEQRQSRDKLQLAARVFENSSEGIMITDVSNKILMVNRAFSDVTGYCEDEVIGKNPRLLSSGKQNSAFYREMWQALSERGEWHGEVENRRKNGEYYVEWLTISAVQDPAGVVTNYVAVFTDITSTKMIEERLNFLAHYDPLTALPNRVLFTDRLEQCVAKARTQDGHVALMFLDLDRFSLINETFGHSAGDQMLKDVSQRLRNSVRPGDSVSRMGGDEFAVVLTDLSAPDEAATYAAKIMQSLAQPLNHEGQEAYLSASIGISVFPDDGKDVESLVRNADSALYRAMEEGRNTFRFYHHEMNSRSSERMSLETHLRHALERGELVMHYQPFIDGRSGRILGAEALLRWRRPDLGFITPASFIPMLEETGLIVPVGEWILETACRDNQKWREMGFRDLFVAVNFSALQLQDAAISRKMDALLRRLDFDPRFLEIELTESMVMKDPAQGIARLNEFKDIGTMLSVDDFGTGYSSLSYLKKLPIDTLKIDRSFITDTPDENEARAIVQAIIAMGHSLDLKIIAEGVQERGQVDFLRQARCDLLQGFYFSSAVSQPQFLDLLAGRTAGNSWPSWDAHLNA